jgi:hypothetical protein
LSKAIGQCPRAWGLWRENLVRHYS